MTTDLPIVELDESEPAADLPRTVLLVGAGGDIGAKLCAAWRDRYELIRLDGRALPDDPEMIAADLAAWNESWTALFDEADTVVYLDPQPPSEGDAIQRSLDGFINVLLAAVQAGIDRVVFASSYRVPDGDSWKWLAERVGRGFAAAFGLVFVALRLGVVQPGENRPESLAVAERSQWLSNADLVRLFTCAVEAELDEGAFVVVPGRSQAAADEIGFMPEAGS